MEESQQWQETLEMWGSSWTRAALAGSSGTRELERAALGLEQLRHKLTEATTGNTGVALAGTSLAWISAPSWEEMTSICVTWSVMTHVRNLSKALKQELPWCDARYTDLSRLWSSTSAIFSLAFTVQEPLKQQSETPLGPAKLWNGHPSIFKAGTSLSPQVSEE